MHTHIITKTQAMTDKDYNYTTEYTDGGIVKESMGSKTSKLASEFRSTDHSTGGGTGKLDQL